MFRLHKYNFYSIYLFLPTILILSKRNQAQYVQSSHHTSDLMSYRQSGCLAVWGQLPPRGPSEGRPAAT